LQAVHSGRLYLTGLAHRPALILMTGSDSPDPGYCARNRTSNLSRPFAAQMTPFGTHRDATVFPVFEADVRAADLRAPRPLVTELAGRELRREGLPPDRPGSLRSQALILARTADRSVPGCMNDMPFRREVAISDAGGPAHLDPGERNHPLHRNITSSRGHRPPVELAAQQPERGQPRRQQTGPEQAPPSSLRSLGSPARPTSLSVAEHHPPESSAAADLRPVGLGSAFARMHNGLIWAAADGWVSQDGVWGGCRQSARPGRCGWRR
jgi:hypothetical protein